MIKIFKIHQSADHMENKGKFIQNYPGYHQNITLLIDGWYKIVEWADGDTRYYEFEKIFFGKIKS